MNTDPATTRCDRRTFLFGASAVILSACGGAAPDSDAGSTDTDAGSIDSGAGTDTTTDSRTDQSSDVETGVEVEALSPSTFEGLALCTLLPSSTPGPFPSRELLDRRDIHEGYPGHPLRLGIRVVDQGCQPVPDAVVDIWHSDATGDYSDYVRRNSVSDDRKDEGEGTTFCRGAQTADADGILEFETIYPGWYEDRAIHIHATVHIDDNPVFTTQLYFDEAYTEAVHTTGIYAESGPPDTGWDTDHVIGDPATDGTGIVLAAAETRSGPGTLGLVNLGIDLA